MADGFVQLPPDSTGKKLRTRDRGSVGHDQYVALAAAPTFDVLADAVAFAANKHHLTLFNGIGSGVVLRLRKLFVTNLQTGTATGVVVRFDVKKATTASAGTTLTPQVHDSSDTSLPAQVTVRTGGIVTEGALLFPWVTSNEEEKAGEALSKSLFQQSVSLLPEGPEIKEYVLREGEGLTIKQITSSTVGSFAWLCVFTVD